MFAMSLHSFTHRRQLFLSFLACTHRLTLQVGHLVFQLQTIPAKAINGFPTGPRKRLEKCPKFNGFSPQKFWQRKIGRLIEGNRVTRFNEVFFFQSVNMVNANHGHLTLPWLLKRNQPNQLFLNVWGTWQVTPPEAYQARSSVLVLNPILWHR